MSASIIEHKDGVLTRPGGQLDDPGDEGLRPQGEGSPQTRLVLPGSQFFPHREADAPEGERK